jgi:lysophospholipase L1-like esterase
VNVYSVAATSRLRADSGTLYTTGTDITLPAALSTGTAAGDGTYSATLPTGDYAAVAVSPASPNIWYTAPEELVSPSTAEDVSLDTLRGFAPRDVSSIVFLGDSFTDRSFFSVASNFAAYQDDGYLNWALINLGQRARVAGILGYVGQNTDVILSHVGDAIATGAGVLVEEGGINDINANNVAVATIQANKLAIWQAAINAGMRVVATTIPPRGSYTGAQKANLYAVNAWIRKQAGLMRGVTVCDWAPALVDPATGNAATGTLRADGIHPTPLGAMRMGARLAAVLGTIVPPLDVLGSGGDPTNILTNGGMTGNTAGLATGWTFTNLAQGAVTATASKVARTDDVPGEWQQVNVASGNATGFQLYQVVAPGASTWAVGNTISGLLEFQRDNDWTNFPDVAASLRLRIQFTGSNRFTYGNNHVSPDPGWTAAMPTSGVLRTPPLVIPTGSTNAIFGLEFAGQGTIRIGRCRMHVGQDATGYVV